MLVCHPAHIMSQNGACDTAALNGGGSTPWGSMCPVDLQWTWSKGEKRVASSFLPSTSPRPSLTPAGPMVWDCSEWIGA